MLLLIHGRFIFVMFLIAKCILLRIGAFIEIAQYCLFFIFKTDKALLVENRSVASSLKL